MIQFGILEQDFRALFEDRVKGLIVILIACPPSCPP
jgi:hypothetical protein